MEQVCVNLPSLLSTVSQVYKFRLDAFYVDGILNQCENSGNWMNVKWKLPSMTLKPDGTDQ